MIIKPDLLKRLEEKKKRLDRLRPFPPKVVEKLREKVILDWTYHSNAIEGNTLTLRETQAVLEAGLTISGKPLKDHLEAINHKEAILWLEEEVNKKEPVNLDVILELHKIILTKINDAEAGRFRHEPVFIRGARFVPPNPAKVYSLMEEFEKWLKENAKIYVVERAALAHFKLVSIHPFFDGNGRTARLLMNLILMQNGYPPAIILAKERKNYFSLLEEGNLKGNIAPFINFIGEVVDQALDLYLFVVEGKEYLRLAEAARGTPYSQEYLSLLARRRVLPSIKVDGVWYTTREEINNYLRKVKE